MSRRGTTTACIQCSCLDLAFMCLCQVFVSVASVELRVVVTCAKLSGLRTACSGE